jgi:hypothetical protein
MLAGGALLLLGAFLITVAVMAQVWVPDRAERVPMNVDSTTYLTGEVDKLNALTGQVEHNPVKVYSLTRVDPKRSDGKVAVWVSTTCANINVDNPPDCLPGTDERVISDTIEVFATDRHTGMAVNDPKYVKGGDQYSGLVNKFPFNTERKDYPVWDGTKGGTAIAKYAATESIGGVKVYRFDTQITDAPISLGPGIDGIYNLTKSVWVEPKTGAIIDQKQRDVRTLANGDPALDMTIRFTPSTVSNYVKDAKDNIAQLKLTEKTVPLVGYVVGALALVLGLLVLIGRRRQRTSDVS